VSHQPPPGAFSPGLYVVATPIGNLGDFSPRAARVLATASLIAAEDTRTAATLLRYVGITVRTISLTEHNVATRTPELLDAARAGVVAIISEAGTPAVSDPGARLVDAAHRAGIPVFPVPGPSALAAALSVAGFHLDAGQGAVFLGFLPRSRRDRETALLEAARVGGVVLFFESPHRLGRTLTEAAGLLGDLEAAVCRELTKLHEEVVRGPLSQLAARFAATRGECTVVLDTRGVQAVASGAWRETLAAMRRAGARRAPAAVEVARLFGVARDDAYAAWEEVGPN
jgi:16S rRNA (cytidine1402-2'-O)-methyltransferase